MTQDNDIYLNKDLWKSRALKTKFPHFAILGLETVPGLRCGLLTSVIFIILRRFFQF